jgi:hypothetical protein
VAASQPRRSFGTCCRQANAWIARSTFTVPTPAVYVAHSATGISAHKLFCDCRAAVSIESIR